MTAAAPRRRLHWWVLALVVYGVELAWLGYAYWHGTPKTLVGDEGAYWQRGLAFAGLAPLEPKLWLWPPAQHWFLGASIRLFGPSLVAVQIVQQGMLLVAAAALRGLWRRVDGRVRAANVAAALFLLNPDVLAFGFYLWPEPLHLAAMLVALWLLVARGDRAPAAAAAGGAFGMALLTKSLLSPFWPFALVLLTGLPRARLVRQVALVVLGIGVVTAPMLYYGWVQTGRPLIADSSGYNLVGGLRDRWRSDYVDDAVAPLYPAYLALPGSPQERNAALLAQARDIVAQQGVLATLKRQLGKQYFRLLGAKTTLVTQLPGPACAGYNGAYHGLSAPAATALEALARSWHVLTLVAFALGLVLWRRWSHPFVWWTLLFFAYQGALFGLVHVKTRFLLPMLPFFCAYGGSLIASLARPGEALSLRAGALRWTAAALFAAVLVALALLGPVLDGNCA